MEGEIEFTVPAVPVAQPRARATAASGHARMYEASSKHAIHAFKASVRHAASLAYSGAPLQGPLRLMAVFVFPRPQAMQWKTKPMPRVPSVAAKGDIDNLTKGLADALNGLLYVDDRQIYSATVEKYVASGDEQPHVLVKFTTEPNP